MLLVDTITGAIFRGNELLEEVLSAAGGGEGFVSARRVEPCADGSLAQTPEIKRVAGALGWSGDQFRLLFQPLGLEGKEAVWSMGDDGAPAFLSSSQRPLWDYCKQRFAQVTNPPIDPLREAHVMSLDVLLGSRALLESPLVDQGQMATLQSDLFQPVCRIDFTFDASQGVQGALEAIQRVRREAYEIWLAKPGMVVLSDRGVNAKRAALPALLALSAAWKEMLRANAHGVPVVIETGQVIETHHLALLVAAGATAVFPYLALELSESLKAGGAANYRQAIETGLRKVLARMGISTVSSYRNSYLFEVVGLNADVCAEYFQDATSVLGGKSLPALLEDSLSRHQAAFADDLAVLADAGLYRFRQSGERHSTSPELVRRMHRYIKSPDAENYRAYAELVETREPNAVRDLLEIRSSTPVALEEVEEESAILRRFSTQAMSLGSLGPEAHRTLAIAMNRLGARSNTGEGGEDPDIYRREPEAGNRVKQVASARFGVTAEYLVQAQELEIKIAQGSKPGEGGQLPAMKVTPYIARLRHAVPGMGLISPPPHHDIYSIEDLAQLIYDLRSINPKARIGVKLVSGAGVGVIAAGVAKAGADVITISGFDGGTGSSPLTSIKNTGLPWEVGLREAHRALVRTGFRSRVQLRVDGGFKSGRDVIVAALLGAQEFGFGTAALLAIGCIMARQCHLNTCPVGIATQDEKLRARFAGNPEMVMSYFRGVAAEVRESLAGLGARSLHEITGSAEKLRPRNGTAAHSLERLLQAEFAPATQVAELRGNSIVVDLDLGSKLAHSKFSSGSRSFTIGNSDRSVGAHLSGQLLRKAGLQVTDADRSKKISDYEFHGTAGQSFGAFLISGLQFRLLGEANDYVGKGLSGGTIAISAGAEACRRGDVLAGNTVLYGATSGQLFIAGRAGERFAVRNSGALAVVEGVGQHGCEYMTAGVVIVLGSAGINFGSGMTGGLSYISRETLSDHTYNQEFVRPSAIEEEEEAWVRRVLGEHVRLTGSPRAEDLLRNRSALPLVRLEPLHLPCPIAQTWSASLSRLNQQKNAASAATFPDTLRPEIAPQREQTAT
jgi:glutamate synthase domain-containing protein 2/glutamate synthase domain-containing protein 3